MANKSPVTTHLVPKVSSDLEAPKRTKGLARQIRERTEGLQEQISEMIRISLDPTHRGQIDAIKWLSERAYGRSPEIAAFAELDDSEARTAIKTLSTEQLEALASSIKKAS